MNEDKYKISTIIPVEKEFVMNFFKDFLAKDFLVSEDEVLLNEGTIIRFKKSNEPNKFFVQIFMKFEINFEKGKKFGSISWLTFPILDFFKEIKSDIKNMRSSSIIYAYEGAFLSDIFISTQFKKAKHIASNPKDLQIKGKPNKKN